MSKRNRRRQGGRAIGSTKAERRHHRQELEATLEWVLNDYMKPVECGVTTVTSAGIDEETGIVQVTINQTDPQFAARLVAESHGRVQVSLEPNTIDAIAPAPLPPHMRE
jgi:hypothetical protein